MTSPPGRLLRQTLVIAVVQVGGGLFTSGALELFFRYRESVEAIETLQQEMARGAAARIKQFIADIERTMRAAAQGQDVVIGGSSRRRPPSPRRRRWTRPVASA
jgi:hypothetical protein